MASAPARQSGSAGEVQARFAGVCYPITSNPSDRTASARHALPRPSQEARLSCDDSKKVTLACPKGHALSESSPSGVYVCDICEEHLGKGTLVWSCRRCDYDVCRTCRSQAVCLGGEPSAPFNPPSRSSKRSQTIGVVAASRRDESKHSSQANTPCAAGMAATRTRSHGRSVVAAAGTAAKRAGSPLHNLFFARGEHSERSSTADTAPSPTSEGHGLEKMRLDLEHQVQQRKVLERSLATERARCEVLAQQNRELMQASERQMLGQQRLQSEFVGQQRMQSAETCELEEQVGALLEIKRQLFTRNQDLERERDMISEERDTATCERTCVVCLDRLKNTVFYRCFHMACCDRCAEQVDACPICRKKVQERLVVYVS